jgi:hypothetical protein
MKPPFDPRQFAWPAGWQPIPLGFEEDSSKAIGYMATLGTDEIHATNFIDELRREMCALHPLFNRTFVPLACSTVDPDDILYFTDDPDEPFAFVHLTWHTECTATFPWCKTFATIDAFFARCSNCE